jgi:hypothetical protein
MALAILVVGLVWVGVPTSTLLLAGVLLMCPLMMFFVMPGMHGEAQSGHAEPRPLVDQMRPDQHRTDVCGVGCGNP